MGIEKAAGFIDDLTIPFMRQMNGTPGGVAAKQTSHIARRKNPDMQTEEMVGTLDHASQLANHASLGLMLGGGALAWGLEKLHKWTGNGVIGKAHGLASTVKNARFGDVPGLGFAAKAISAPPIFAAQALAKGAEAVGVNRFFSNRAAGAFAKHSALLDAHVDSLVHAPVPQAAVEHIQALHGMLAEGPDALRGYMRAEHGQTSQFEAAVTAVKEAAGNNKAAQQALKNVAKTARKTVEAQAAAHGWADLSKTTANSLNKVANANIGHGLMNAGIITGVAVSDIRTGLDAKKAVAALKEMYCDLTGTKPNDVSAMTLMLGKVPQPVAAARTQLLKEFGPAALIDAVNTAVNVDFVARNRAGMLGIGLMIAAGMASGMVRGALHGNILPAYQGIKEAHQAHQAASAELYTQLAGEAYAELWARGGANCESAKALGDAYAKEQLSPVQVLREVQDGRMKQRLDALHAAYAQSTGEPMEHVHDVHCNHVQRLAGEKDKTPKEVMGAHTQRLAQHTAHAAQPALS